MSEFPSQAQPLAAPDVQSPARRQLLALATATGGALLAGAIFNPARADLIDSLGRFLDLDPTILNFAFEMEELEADFFSRITSAPGYDSLDIRQRNILNEFAAQDRIHFEILNAARRRFGALDAGSAETLNQASSRRPRFFKYPKLSSREDVLKAALDLKENVLFAYHGAAGVIDNKQILAQAVAIAGVEGRHVAVLRESMGLDPVPAPFEGALEAQIAGRKLGQYGFQGGAPRTR